MNELETGSPEQGEGRGGLAECPGRNGVGEAHTDHQRARIRKETGGIMVWGNWKGFLPVINISGLLHFCV